MVKAAYSRGKPAFGVGGGNSTMVIDETADIADAARNARLSKTSTSAPVARPTTTCSSTTSLRRHDRPAPDRGRPPRHRRAVAPRAGDVGRRRHPHRRHGRPTRPKLAAAAGYTIADDRTFIIVEQDQIGPEHRFSGEKLTTLLAVYRYHGFDDVLAKVRQIYEVAGKGHSCGIYSFDDDHIDALARVAPVSRIMVRQPQSKANAGSFTNRMPMTSSLGCGIWGGNVTNENISLGTS